MRRRRGLALGDEVGARRQRKELRDAKRHRRQQAHRDEHLDEAESAAIGVEFCRHG